MTELEALLRQIARDERNISHLESTSGATGLERVALDAVVHWADAADLLNSEARCKAADNLFRIADIAREVEAGHR